MNTAILNLNVVAPPPPGPSSDPAVWSATMTVGESGDYEGYVVSGSSLLPDGTGSISDTMFTLEGTEYTVENAMTNGLRHSNASRVTISLSFESHELCMSISDDGVGLPDDYAERGHGFRNMVADAERMGGDVQAAPGESGRGATVTCTIPHGAITTQGGI